MYQQISDEAHPTPNEKHRNMLATICEQMVYPLATNVSDVSEVSVAATEVSIAATEVSIAATDVSEVSEDLEKIDCNFHCGGCKTSPKSRFWITFWITVIIICIIVIISVVYFTIPDYSMHCVYNCLDYFNYYLKIEQKYLLNQKCAACKRICTRPFHKFIEPTDPRFKADCLIWKDEITT